MKPSAPLVQWATNNPSLAKRLEDRHVYPDVAAIEAGTTNLGKAKECYANLKTCLEMFLKENKKIKKHKTVDCLSAKVNHIRNLYSCPNFWCFQASFSLFSVASYFSSVFPQCFVASSDPNPSEELIGLTYLENRVQICTAVHWFIKFKY